MPPGDLSEWDQWLEEVEREAVELAGHATAARRGRSVRSGEPAAWADRLVAQVRAWRAELAAVAPWIGAVRSCDHQADSARAK